jgi:hypothetical protein
MQASKRGRTPRAWILLTSALILVIGACSSNSSKNGVGSSNAGNGAGDESAKSDPGGSATETNVATIRCSTDSDCGQGRTCMHNPGQDDGSCSGGLHEPHPASGGDEDAGSAAPPPHSGGLAAKCDVDADCGSVKCLHPNGAGEPGVCDVAQMGAR